jgi:hypothetical protein
MESHTLVRGHVQATFRCANQQGRLRCIGVAHRNANRSGDERREAGVGLLVGHGTRLEPRLLVVAKFARRTRRVWTLPVLLVVAILKRTIRTWTTLLSVVVLAVAAVLLAVAMGLSLLWCVAAGRIGLRRRRRWRNAWWRW